MNIKEMKASLEKPVEKPDYVTVLTNKACKLVQEGKTPGEVLGGTFGQVFKTLDAEDVTALPDADAYILLGATLMFNSAFKTYKEELGYDPMKPHPDAHMGDC
jgi:hypothetical protein